MLIDPKTLFPIAKRMLTEIQIWGIESWILLKRLQTVLGHFGSSPATFQHSTITMCNQSIDLIESLILTRNHFHVETCYWVQQIHIPEPQSLIVSLK